MFFPAEPLNQQDRIFTATRRPELLLARVLPPSEDMEPTSRLVLWNIVLPQG
jgi:hypothetical protein